VTGACGAAGGRTAAVAICARYPLTPRFPARDPTGPTAAGRERIDATGWRPAILGRAVKAPATPPCRCCGAPKSRWRGLCHRCWRGPSVRERYPSLPPCGKRPDEPRGSRPLGEPTSALPGSPAKLLVLMARAARHEELFNARDAGMGSLA
jgi:hypothetical protein